MILEISGLPQDFQNNIIGFFKFNSKSLALIALALCSCFLVLNLIRPVKATSPSMVEDIRIIWQLCHSEKCIPNINFSWFCLALSVDAVQVQSEYSLSTVYVGAGP